MESTISLSEKKIAEFVPEAERHTSRFEGLRPLNHHHTNQLRSREHKRNEELWLRLIVQENHQVIQTFPA